MSHETKDTQDPEAQMAELEAENARLRAEVGKAKCRAVESADAADEAESRYQREADANTRLRAELEQVKLSAAGEYGRVIALRRRLEEAEGQQRSAASAAVSRSRAAVRDRERVRVLEAAARYALTCHLRLPGDVNDRLLAALRPSPTASEEPQPAPCGCGGKDCTGPGDNEHHQCGGPKEACCVPGCRECGTPQPAQDPRDALAALVKRTAHGGSIISSATLTAEQIAIARAADRLWVSPEGLGFVYVPGPVGLAPAPQVDMERVRDCIVKARLSAGYLEAHVDPGEIEELLVQLDDALALLSTEPKGGK